MTQTNRLYNLGYTDGINNKTRDTRYKEEKCYLDGYDMGQDQRAINIKRLILKLKGIK